MKNILIFCVAYLLLTCGQPISNQTIDGEFALYLLNDSTVTAADAFSQPIDMLTLASSPFFTGSEIKYYNWTLHSFDLADQMRVIYEQFLLSHGKTSGVPFVVTVGNDRIYMGTFWWAYSSSMPPPCAVIEAIAPLPYKITIVNGAIDKRGDQRIYHSLKNSGVLVEY